MVLLDARSDLIPKPCVATVGFFDGVHRGHLSLIEQVRDEAASSGLSSSIITFDRHPRQVLHSDFIPDLLTLLPEKIELLQQTGIDYCLLLSFTPELAAFTAQQFMNQVIQNRCNARTLIIGYDHRFGRNRSEGYEQYVKYGQESNLLVKQASPLCVADRAISSSFVRELLTQGGHVDKASQALGYFYTVSGLVVRGRGQGHVLGFPTANIECAPGKLIPEDGVYAAMVRLEEEENIHPAVLNIGCRPTLNNGIDRTIEVHLLDFSGNLYDLNLHVSFLKRLRAQHRFNSLNELSKQIKEDTHRAMEVFLSICSG